MEYAVLHLRLIVGVVITAAMVTAVIALTFACTVLVLAGEQHRLVVHDGVIEQRGLVLPTWQRNGYDGPATAQAISDIAGVGATWIQFTPTWNMATGTSSTIDGASTVTDAAVQTAIDLAHGQGLKVMLKPHVDPLDGTPRWQINPSDRAAWFTSYQSMITHYATIAQQKGVDEFSVGCELATMSGSADRSAWLTVINAIKAIYSGPLVYAAQASEYPDVSFWDQLGFIGIDAYFPLSTTPTTDISELEAGWIPIRDQMSAFAVGAGRQIVFTEAGYPSLVGAAVEPWNNQYRSAPSQQEQAAAYEALLATFSGQPWWAGVFWWSWWTDNGVSRPLDHAIRGKQAESVLKNWWTSTPFVHPSLCRLPPSSGRYTATLGQNPTYWAGQE
jgi:hypothetical protein